VSLGSITKTISNHDSFALTRKTFAQKAEDHRRSGPVLGARSPFSGSRCRGPQAYSIDVCGTSYIVPSCPLGQSSGMKRRTSLRGGVDQPRRYAGNVW
jgi:hypothetical protein